MFSDEDGRPPSQASNLYRRFRRRHRRLCGGGRHCHRNGVLFLGGVGNRVCLCRIGSGGYSSCSTELYAGIVVVVVGMFPENPSSFPTFLQKPRNKIHYNFSSTIFQETKQNLTFSSSSCSCSSLLLGDLNALFTAVSQEPAPPIFPIKRKRKKQTLKLPLH